MSRSLQLAFSFLILGLVVGGPLWYKSFRHARYRNFRVVQEGVLYRSGQMTLGGLSEVVEKKGIKTVVNLRDGDANPDQLEEEYCASRGIRYVRIAQKPWTGPDNSVPNAEGVNEFLAVMKDRSSYPVLLHCFAGHHRTGAYCAVYRMELEGWSPTEAIREMMSLGYDTILTDRDVCSYLQNYRPVPRR
jgi:tyrosine-protein phosphatase SIW14